MFDIGWSELLLIAVIAILVIGPQDLPKVMHAVGRIVRRLQYVRYAFTQQFEDFMQEADLNDIRKQVNFEAPKDHKGDHVVFDEAAADADENFPHTDPENMP